MKMASPTTTQNTPPNRPTSPARDGQLRSTSPCAAASVTLSQIPIGRVNLGLQVRSALLGPCSAQRCAGCVYSFAPLRALPV